MYCKLWRKHPPKLKRIFVISGMGPCMVYFRKARWQDWKCKLYFRTCWGLYQGDISLFNKTYSRYIRLGLRRQLSLEPGHAEWFSDMPRGMPLWMTDLRTFETYVIVIKDSEISVKKSPQEIVNPSRASKIRELGASVVANGMLRFITCHCIRNPVM